ncbi:MAG: hypothetical protein IPG45_27545 [Deltaproteobacteria bacterium]|nr:hypothetical protein [Deltaproteobacteria bacterium]
MSIFPRGLTFIALSAMACSSEPNDDQGPRDAGGDAGLDGGADAGLVDLGPDPSLDGTTLEGIEVRWLEPVELCTAWQSGRALADELALKVHLTLGPEPRPSLGRAHLAAATLRGGQLRLGPLSDQQYAITNVSSRVTRYELQDPSGNTRLSAEVQHTLPSGVLSERFLVSRQVNDRSPVQLGTRNEHHFYFTPNGRSEGTDLEPCGGSAELEPGMFVLSAGTGANALTLLRFANTREVQVGSAPMVPTGGLLQLAADPYDLVPFSGFWSQTYVAGHHNWDESSLFDFTRDLGLYETVFEPLQRGGTPLRGEVVARIALANVGGPSGGGSITVTTLDTSNGQEREDTFATPAGWVRVDAPHLQAGFQECAGAQVQTLTSGNNTVLQVFTCPQANNPGFSLRALIPVLFSADPGVTGRRFDGAAITSVVVDGRAGFQVALGALRVRITKNPPDDYFFVDVLDAGGNSLESSLAYPTDYTRPWREDEVLSYANNDRTLQVEVRRRWAAPGVGESSIYAPVSLRLQFDGQTHLIDAWDRLDYTNTHHNWGDVLVAQGDGLTIRWEVRFGNGLTYHLRVTRDVDGAVLVPESQVEPQ